MPGPAISPIRDLEDGAQAFARVGPEIDAQDPNHLSAVNVDIGSAAAVAFGVAPQLAPFRDAASHLPDFDVRCFDGLSDYAKAALYLYVTNLPVTAPGDTTGLVEEVLTLRGKLLVWAEPLAAAGKFSKEAVAKIKEGHGHKDAACDLIALAAMYRSVWEDIRTMCGVTFEEVERGAKIGPALYATLSRKDFETTSPSEHALRLRKAWTLLDRAYRQCQRAVAYFRFEEGDADTIAPSLRKNMGPATRPAKTTTTPAATTPLSEPPALEPVATGPALGGGSNPFVEA